MKDPMPHTTDCGKKHFYRAYGMVMESDLACPELVAAPAEEAAHLRIQWGQVPDTLANMTACGFKFQANRDHVLIKTDRIAKLLISHGSRILIEPRDGALDHEIRLLVLGWGVGAVLHQRGIFPLHACAVGTDNGCAAFCAPSGGGKSTLALAFLKRGHRLLDDNIVAVRLENGQPLAYPGYPEIKLMTDALQAWGDGMPSNSMPVLRKSAKFAVQVRSRFQEHPQPIRNIYVLKRGAWPSLNIVQLKGAPIFYALTANIFCVQFAGGMGKASQHFNTVITLSDKVRVFQVQLPLSSPAPDELAGSLAEHFNEG